MGINLTNSYRDRQAILSNTYLIQKIEEHFNFDEYFWYDRLIYEGDFVITEQQLSYLFNVSKITIKKYLVIHDEEVKANGYQLLKGRVLQYFLSECDSDTINNAVRISYSDDINNAVKVLKVFTFKACLNIAMLLVESEPAKFIRSRILDIAIDLAAEKEGDRVKYINRPIRYIFPASYNTFCTCSKEFKKAAQKYIELDYNTSLSNDMRFVWERYNWFAVYYENIYQLVFGNNHDSYKQAMLLHTDYKNYDNEKQKRAASFRHVKSGYRLRNALYYEAYRAMNNIERGVAKKLKLAFTSKGRKLDVKELNAIVSNLDRDTKFIPLIQEARTKMALVNSLNTNPKLYKEVINERFKAHKQAIKETDLNEFAKEKLENIKEKLLTTDFYRLG